MANLSELIASQEQKISNKSESKYDVLRVHPSKISLIWRSCYPLLLKSLPVNPEMDLPQIIAGLADESLQFWVVARLAEGAVDAVFLTAIERDRGEWVLSLFNLGGSGARHWVGDVHRAMHQFARLEGCARVRMCGRPAWQRILPNYPVVGERAGHLVYERPVED